ncbi:MAG: SBBP repeat-containing protein [Acidobacteriaceae bacterium]|nr:SBBP repeat-containing protein [Acidobacteriaceae bacterium]MBV9781947.1 SBBP repeat-containing protein [Acidobacteriaceae bacterium]
MRISLKGNRSAGYLQASRGALLTFLGGVAFGFPATLSVPLSFEENRGQTDKEVQFLARTPDATVFLSRDAVVFDFRGEKQHVSVLRMKFVGAKQTTKIVGVQALDSKLNYLIGNDPHRWYRGLRTYAGVKYTEIYPGIDVLYRGNGRDFEYDFMLSPGTDPRNIQMEFPGVALRVDTNGDLIAGLRNREVRIHRPIAYQQELKGGERQSVDIWYVLHTDKVGFRVGAYDLTKCLVIDPTIVYSTYLGGSGDEGIFGIKFDAAGNIYVAGETSSLNFPTEHPIQPKLGGSYDCFISKFDPSGSRLIYSTYLGGSGYDHCSSLALGADGSAYVAGVTMSADFPIANALQNKLRGKQSGFVSRLNSEGTDLIFSTYLGGSGTGDAAGDLALDGEGNALVTGFTNSTDFPVTKGAYQTVCDGGANPGQCIGDAFVTKLSASGQRLLYSTYLGGAGYDGANAIAVDRYGSACITGQTSSADFPLRNAYQKAIAGPANAFVTKLDPGGCALEFSTYLGGNSYDAGLGIVVDESRDVLVTGFTGSTNFPLAHPYQSKYGGGSSDAFVTKFATSGSELIYSTYLGGSGMDFAVRIAVDPSGNAAVVGFTSSTDFPVLNALQEKYGGGYTDGFITRFGPDGHAEFSTYLGGKGDEYGYAINADQEGSIWVGGSTSSRDFPLVKPFQKHYAGGLFDAFLTKISVGHID